ncbi:TetR/AcrR family transcriptional regulator [Streptomyces fractus]|uniref:TetR/AcrR family transcriptional regulator n=1 Tax=Streptomyces fractus TaxID=641806 RepID=UPI003CEABEE4
MSRRTTPAPHPETPARPLRADAERNRQRLIAAAREVFAQRGLEVTLDDIAHHAGVGVGTAYRRFANREELVESVLENEVRRMLDEAEEALTHQDAWEALVHFFLGSAQAFADNRGLRDVLLHSAHGRTRVAAVRERLTPAVSALITRAQRDGRLRDDIEPTDFPLIQLMLGAVTQASRDVAPELWKRYVILLLDGLRNDRDRPTPLGHRALDQHEFDRTMT